MVKTNYNKVEDAIVKGLEDLKVASLIAETKTTKGKSKETQSQSSLTAGQMMTIINQELKKMYEQDKTVYKALKLKKLRIDELTALAKNKKNQPTELEMKEISELKGKIDEYKKLHFPEKSNEDLLAEEMRRHIYKRHNTQEKWIPLDTHSDWDKYKKQKRTKK